MRLAWFSPLPPSTSGIAAYSSEILPLLAARGLEIDRFTHDTAHEFVWRHRRQPYHLTIFQMGNAACHDFMWAYLFRYPGLTVLHDLQLHQARALFLSKRWQPRRDDYIAEVQANHPDAPDHLPFLVLARMGDRMYQHWPMTRLVIDAARLIVVHNARVAESLRERHPQAQVRTVEMGVADPLGRSESFSHDDPDDVAMTRRSVRDRHQMPPDAFLVAAYGGVTPEKRIPQVLRAFAAVAARHPHAHLMLVGTATEHYDVLADATFHDVAERVHITGFVPDAELPAYLQAADVCMCLRWPTNRETSASWLRCLAAGQPTVITELTHLADVPSLDPRGWRLIDTASEPREPVTVSIDVLDEDHSLQLALERLISDAPLRARLGRAARDWWTSHHQLETMATEYMKVIEEAATISAPRPKLPPHLTADGTSTLRTLAEGLGLGERIDNLLPH